MRSMVEGAHLGAARNDAGQDRVQVPKHIRRGNPHHFEPSSPKHRVSYSIPAGLVATTVSFSVDFNDHPTLKTGKINRHLSNRKLSSKFESVRPSSKHLPEQDLRQAHLAPQLPCALYLLDRSLEDAWAPSTSLRLVPLPVSGRNFWRLQHARMFPMFALTRAIGYVRAHAP